MTDEGQMASWQRTQAYKSIMKVRSVQSRFGLSPLRRAEPNARRTAMKEAGWKEDQAKCQNRSIPLPSLRQLRQSRGLSQRELGKLAKVSAGTVYRLENGLRGAYPVTVKKLASALGVSVVELVQEHRLR
jgi:DNA-binding XRE family transcriptional regulator